MLLRLGAGRYVQVHHLDRAAAVRRRPFRQVFAVWVSCLDEVCKVSLHGPAYYVIVLRPFIHRVIRQVAHAVFDLDGVPRPAPARPGPAKDVPIYWLATGL